MFSQQHVKRNPNQTSNVQYESRMQSNSQPIPINPSSLGSHPMQRPGAQQRSLTSFSPAQSPQTHQYVPSMYHSNMGQGEMNTSNYHHGVAQSPSVKSHTNGQYGSGGSNWSGAIPMNYQTQTHQQSIRSQHSFGGGNTMSTNYPRPSVQNTAPQYRGFAPTQQNIMQSAGSTGMQYTVRPQAPRYSPVGAHSSGNAFPPNSTTFYQQTQPPFFSTRIPPPPHFGGGHYDQASMFQNQQVMHNNQPLMQQQASMSMSMPQPQQQQQPLMTRKKVTIKDPKTLRDVTNDILQPGSQSDTSSVPSQSPATTSMGFQQTDQIAAQFAAQVAAAASHDKPTSSNMMPSQHPSAPSEMAHSPMHYPQHLQTLKSTSPVPGPAGSLVPLGVDTSIPPPSLPVNIPQMIPPGTSIPNKPFSTPPPSMQGLPQHFPPGAGNILGSSPKTISVASTSPRFTDPPVAIVQPVSVHPQQLTQPQIKPIERLTKPPLIAAIPIKTDDERNQKIEEIISTAEELKRENDKAENLLHDIVSAQPPKSNEKSIESEVPFPAAMPPEPALNDNEQDTKDKRSEVDRATTPPVTDDVILSLSQEADTDVAFSESSEATDKNVTDLSAESVRPFESEAVSSEIQEESPAETIILEEKGDVPVSESPKAELESNDKAGTPLSSGDSAVNEPADKAVPKSPEVEVVSESEQGTDATKDELPLVSQSSKLVTDETNQGEVTAESEAPESAPVEAESNDQPTGKKVYDREFLLQFRFHSSSMEKPIDLPPIDEIIMDKPPPKSSFSNAPPFFRDGPDFAPSWMRGPSSRGGRQSSRGSRPGPPRQGFGGGYQGQMGPPKVITKSIQKEPELNKAENAWKPSKMEAKSTAASTTEEEQTEEVLKNVRAILNKLTPQKFGALMIKFKQLPINSELRLREVTNLIFEKAIDEPNFCEAYANMCRTMSQFKVSTPTPSAQGGATQTSTVEFRKVLLTRCQKEFERDRANEDKLSDLRKKVEDAKTPEEKQQLKEELSYAEGKERRRMLGNIRFIGELFKLNMLTETIMHNCVMSLFRGRDDESLESLCRLLTTIGKDLDHPKGKARMDQYFQKIEQIIKERRTSSRVRFMLKDVVDLRLNNWVPRATKAQGPKTIDQIHQDAKEEKEQQAALHQAAAAAAAASAPKNQSRGGRMGSRGNNQQKNADDGWTKVQKPMRIDPMKMKLSKFDESNVTLGPSRGKLGWKSGSGSSTTRTGSGGYSNRDALEGNIPRSSTPTTMNRFSALGGGTGNQDYTQRGYGKVSSQERTRSDSRGSSGSSRGTGRDEKQLALDTVRRLTSLEKKQGYSGELTQKAAPNVPDVRVDETAISKKVNSIIEEYLCIHDIKEAGECFDELNLPPTHQHLIVRNSLEVSLEKTSTDRAHVGKLFSSLVRDGKILPAQYLKGVTSNMELAIDLELDLPKVWSCVAEQISSIFYESGGKIELHSLKEMTSPLSQANKAHLLIAEVLKLLIRHTNVDAVVQYWLTSNMPMDLFMKTSNPVEVQEFFTKQGLLEFYNLCHHSSLSQISNTNFEHYKVSITRQLELYKENEPVLHWIDENISPDDKLESSFIRALTTAVCNNAIVQGQQNIELNKSVLTDRSMLLKRYINDDAMELTALYALQRLYVNLEQPPNLLKMIFNVLYDEDVISEQTFFKWKEEDNPEESEGKGVAILSATSFFTWLLKAEEESDE